jgi:hypothetical protein
LWSLQVRGGHAKVAVSAGFVIWSSCSAFRERILELAIASRASLEAGDGRRSLIMHRLPYACGSVEAGSSYPRPRSVPGVCDNDGMRSAPSIRQHARSSRAMVAPLLGPQ